MKAINSAKVIGSLGIIALLAGSWQWLSPGETDSPYRFSHHILNALHADTTSGRFQKAAQDFSFIGEYRQALAYYDKAFHPNWTITAGDSLSFLQYKPVNAREYILQRAGKEQIIIINEAHHKPLHRVFTASLLEELYQLGFRYFGAETLSHRDSTLNNRRYPAALSGYYTVEPQYGHLIREALRLNYYVFPYEASTIEEFKSGKSREIAQARNIAAILKQDPAAKILIHCGYAHAWEAPLESDWEKAMAGRLKEFTGIDPFTIDQERWTEAGDRTKENPFYQMIEVSEPSVLINAAGEAFSAVPPAPALTDIRVAHPRTTYRYGRPDWMLREGKWRPYLLTRSQLSLGFPCLVFAYREGENGLAKDPFLRAVPMDVMELADEKDRKALILPPGKYRIVLLNPAGNQKEFSIGLL